MISLTPIVLVGLGVRDLIAAFSYKILLKQLMQLNTNERLLQQ